MPEALPVSASHAWRPDHVRSLWALSADSYLHVVARIFTSHFQQLMEDHEAGTADALLVMPGEESRDNFQKG